MERAFKAFSITSGGTPQPLIGTYLTAALVVSTPGRTVKVAVHDSSMFQPGDWALFQSYALTGNVPNYSERHKVLSVPDSTHIVVGEINHAFVAGGFGTADWVIFASQVNSVFVQAIENNSALLYIGDRAAMNKTGYVFVIAYLEFTASGSQGYNYTSTRYGNMNADPVSQYFIDGTTSDQYLPSVGIV